MRACKAGFTDYLPHKGVRTLFFALIGVLTAFIGLFFADVQYTNFPVQGHKVELSINLTRGRIYVFKVRAKIITGTQKSCLSQNTDYHILMYFDVLNTNPLSIWCHQPLILRHSYHKRGKLRITGFMKNINE